MNSKNVKNIRFDCHDKDHYEYYYPQQAQRAGGIVRVWQIFGHGYDFTTWSELGTKSRVKVTYFNGKKYLKEFKKYL